MMSEWEVGGKKKDLGDILHSAIFNFVQITWKYLLKFDHYFIDSLLYYNLANLLHVNIGLRGGGVGVFKNLKKKISDINY